METDPNGLDQHEPGAKVDAGKPRVHLIYDAMPRALWQIAAVGTFGAEKYTDHGWQEVPDAINRYRDAMYRHQIKRAAGELFDQDSGLLHAAHEAWNALAILELTVRQINEFQQDESQRES